MVGACLVGPLLQLIVPRKQILSSSAQDSLVLGGSCCFCYSCEGFVWIVLVPR